MTTREEVEKAVADLRTGMVYQDKYIEGVCYPDAIKIESAMDTGADLLERLLAERDAARVGLEQARHAIQSGNIDYALAIIEDTLARTKGEA